MEFQKLQHRPCELENSDEVAIHLHGLSQLIRSAGGFAAMVPRTEVSWVLHLADIVSYGAVSAGMTPLSTYAFHRASRLKLGQRAFQPLIPLKEDLRPIFEEFVGVYRALYLQAEARFPVIQARVEQSHILFRRGTPIHRLIRSTSDVTPIEPVQIILYLNLILLEHATLAPSKLSEFFLRIRKSMVNNDLDVGGSRFVLIWVLITDASGHRLDSPARVQLLSRLCRVYQQLSTTLRRQYEESLMFFLTDDETEIDGPLLEPLFRRVVMDSLGSR